MPFEDVGEITKVKVRLVEEGQRCPSDTRKKKKKRFFSLAGYTLGNVSSRFRMTGSRNVRTAGNFPHFRQKMDTLL